MSRALRSDSERYGNHFTVGHIVRIARLVAPYGKLSSWVEDTVRSGGFVVEVGRQLPSEVLRKDPVKNVVGT